MGMIIAIIVSIIMLLLGALGSLFNGLLKDELKAWLPIITKLLIDRSVASLPNALRDRYREEWESFVDEMPGPLSKLFQAVMLLRAAQQITYEHKTNQIRPSIIDRICGLATIVYFAPVFLVISFLVVMDGGPVFVRKETIFGSGENGFRLEHLCFRTTYWQPGKQGVQTPLGSFLIKTSLAEFPLVFYLASGNISLANVYTRSEGYMSEYYGIRIIVSSGTASVLVMAILAILLSSI